MKSGIHPEYNKVVFRDTTTGYEFLSGSTQTADETVEWEDGNTYPLIRVEISSDSHPFYTGKQESIVSTKNSASQAKKTKNNIYSIKTTYYPLGSRSFFL